jgi:hypothetical protein
LCSDSAVKEITYMAVSIPTDLIREFIDILSGKTPFDKFKAVKLGLQLAQWAYDTFGDVFTAASVKAPPGTRVSKKKLIEALKALSDKDEVSAKAFPVWLIPIILKLVLKWMAS